MTFNAIISAEHLSNYFEPLSALVDECKLSLGQEGLSVRAVDPASVGMIETTLDAAAFESYESRGDRIGLDLDRFEDVLGMADSDHLIQLRLDEQSRKLDIRFGEVDYTQALIDPEAIRQEPEIPSLDAPVTLTATGKQLRQGVTAADLVDDHIEFRSDDAQPAFVIDADGDTDDVQVTYERDALIDAQIPASVWSVFSLDYLTDMVGVIDDDAAVRIELDESMPVTMRYEHSEGLAAVTYVLSPRVAGGD